jgi:5-hydroxyisourate hydrolase-like protein (transthyretin family)
MNMNRAATAILLSLSFFVAAMSAQQTSSLEGIVVKRGTTDPLAGVEVELSRVEGKPEVTYTRTGNDGRFLFRDLSEGTYRLVAARGGTTYYPAEFGQHHPLQRGVSFSIAASEAKKDVRIEMTQTGAIAGRVVDSDGEPLGHVTVLALSRQFRAGEPRLYIETATVTDEQGNYRLFGLFPGQYSIAAVYESPQRRTINLPVALPGQMTLNERATSVVVTHQTMQDGSVIEEAYGVVYYGGVLDASSAMWIEVGPGSTFAGADIPYGAGKRKTNHIRGVVVNADTGQPAGGAQLLATPQKQSPNALVLTATANAAGVFDLAGAFSEGYVISATGAGAPRDVGGRTIPGPPLMGHTPVTVAGRDVEARVVLNAGLTLTGRVVIEGKPVGVDDPALSQIRIRLRRDPDLLSLPVPAQRSGNGQVTAKGEFTLSIWPGDFRLDVEGIPETTYLKSIPGLHIANAPEPVEVLLGTDGVPIRGTVVDGSHPVPNAIVVLVPAERGRIERYRNTATDSAGAFRLKAIPPGDYKLFAWEWVPSESWLNAEFLRDFENQGITVRVAAADKEENLQLRAIAVTGGTR